DAPPQAHWPTRPAVELPAPGPVDATLTEALRARHTSRDLTGPLSAQQLSSLLWTAQSPTGSHHPYPSAGARYCARIRPVASNVRAGLIGGFYDDLAHDVLNLDGVNNPLVYLLPVAGQDPRRDDYGG